MEQNLPLGIGQPMLYVGLLCWPVRVAATTVLHAIPQAELVDNTAAVLILATSKRHRDMPAASDRRPYHSWNSFQPAFDYTAMFQAVLVWWVEGHYMVVVVNLCQCKAFRPRSRVPRRTTSGLHV